jgi:hypothetical protein
MQPKTADRVSVLVGASAINDFPFTSSGWASHIRTSDAALSRLKHGFESRRERQQYQRVSGQAGSASRTFLKRKAISAVHQHRVCGPVNDLHRRPGWCGGCSGVGRAANRSPCPTIEVAQSTVAFSRWASPTIRPLSGSPGRLPRHSLGMKHPPISFETVTVLTAVPSPIVSRQWAFVITRLRLAHPGKMGMRKG